MLYYILGIITGLLIANREIVKKEVKLMTTRNWVVSREKAQFIDPISDEEKIMQPFNE